jgi:cob(I)alamin adenosyltransferase
VFTGDGKGKTTAAVGTAVRAAGCGLRVLIVFFLKGKMFSHGEVVALSRIPGIETVSYGVSRWIKKGVSDSEASNQAQQALEASARAVKGGNYDLVVMDEVNAAVDFGLVPVKDVMEVISIRPENVDIILTGRQADPCIIMAADIVTEMVNSKHAFERGVEAREGIDY